MFEKPDELAYGRRDILKYAAASLIYFVTPLSRAAIANGPVGILGVRIWPASDYTRVTLEYGQAIKYTYQVVKDPYRLVVDLEGVELNSVMQSLPGKISETDPYIKGIRAGRNKPGVVRLVIELKTDVAPQVFTLKPVGDYGNRLVLDLYPAIEADPLLDLIAGNDVPDRNVATAGSSERQSKTELSSRNETRVSDEGTSKDSKLSRMITVVLDPGHGGEDPGAVGAAGNYEKDVVLSIAHRLRKRIDAETRMRSALTRDGDYFIPLGQRVSKARKVQADLFVSIHADAFLNQSARGSSVFVLSEHGATSSAARWMANRENAADLIGGVNLDVRDPYLAKTLFDLSQTATINDSLRLGKDVLKELGGVNTLHRGAVEQASFAVLKAPDIPSILVETAFISNPEEERRLTDDSYQDKMADAILRGIKSYFAKNPSLAKSKMARLD